MTDEVNLPKSGESVELSPITPAEPDAALLVAPKKKSTKEMSDAERKAYNREAQKTTRSKKKTASFVFDSDVEVTKADAKKILGDRGLQNTHIVDTVYKLLTRAAEEHEVPANRFLFQNGIVKMLESFEKGEAQTLESIPAEPVTGELSTRAELYALYDASLATRSELTFEEFLATRLRCKKDCWFLGKEILDKDFSDCHREWTEFFPKFDPTTLQPGYTQKQAIKWLNDHSEEIKTFMLLASRSAFKSSWSHIWILSLILCQPSIRILLVSETKPLSKDFIGVIRSYFETTPGQETKFARLFPEFTIPTGDGSVLSLEVPMAHLKLAQSITSTSMDSAVAGNRCDVALFDDGISSTSCGNDVQIQASINKFLAIGKLVEVGGLKLVLGTPWAFNDLYNYIIEMSEAEGSGIAVRVDPAFSVKPEAKHKLTPALLSTLREDEIASFLFPERLNWKFLRREIGTTQESAAFFLSQNLCIFPKQEDEGLTVSFTEDEIRARIRPASFFEAPVGMSQVVMSLDRAFSVSRYADFSCITVGKIFQREKRAVCGILDVKLERLKESALVDLVVSTIDRYNPVAFVLEKDKGYENLVETIRKTLIYRGIAVPRIIAKEVPAGGKNLHAKARRIKILELPLSDGRLWFAASALWNDVLIAQFTAFDGITRSNSSRKDDAPDSVALLYETFMPKVMSAQDSAPTDQEKIDKEVDQQQEQEKRRAMHDRMFLGTGIVSGRGNQPTDSSIKHSDWQRQQRGGDPQPEAPPPRPMSPRDAALQQMMKILPPGLRNRGQR